MEIILSPQWDQRAIIWKMRFISTQYPDYREPASTPNDTEKKATSDNLGVDIYF